MHTTSRLAAVSLTLISLITLISLAGCSSSRSATTPSSGSQGINTTLDRWHRAAAEGDLATYAALMTPEAVFLGTDRSERWVGSEFLTFAEPYFADGHGWTYTPVDRRLALFGDVAWIDEDLRHETYGNCRGTAVLIHDDHGWRIAHYSLTFPVPNAIARDVVEQIQRHEAESGG